MRSSTILRRWRAALLALVAASTAASALGFVPPAQAGTPSAARSSSHPASRPSPSKATDVVTLLTGDRVVVRHDSSGRLSTSLTPGSPHYGEPVQTIHTPGHAWTIPSLATAVRKRLDPALFDVAALARHPHVALRVTFASGVSPRGLPGLTLQAHGVRRLADGRTSALVSYDARRPLPSSLVNSLRGVSRIAPAEVDAPAKAHYQLHTMTLDVTDAHRSPLTFGNVFLINTDHARLFANFGAVTNGQWKVSVPQGHYLAFVTDSGFHYTLAGRATVSDDNAEVALSLADATVRPAVQAPPGFVRSSRDLEVYGFDSAHRKAVFSVSLSNASPRLTPLAGRGRLVTELSNTWTPRGSDPKSRRPVSRIVMSKVLRAGIPRRLSVPYRPGRYADVTIKQYATGETSRDQATTMYALDPRDNTFNPTEVRTVRPGVLHARLLGGKNLGWFIGSNSEEGRNSVDMQSLATYHRGQHAVLPFFRGPLAPFSDRGWHTPNVFGPDICPICVVKGSLTGFASLLSSAGSDAGGSAVGTYAVYRGHHRLVQGVDAIRPDVRHVEPGEHLRLVSSMTPPSKSFTLSSRVHDEWRVRVPKGRNAIVPLLRAAYVPPTDLHSVSVAGRVSYPITFDNVGPVAARVEHASVRWSTDGRSWHAAGLSRVDENTFRVSYRNPAATPARKYVDLEVSARDVAGRTVSESVTHAYLLPSRTARSRQASGAAHASSGPSRAHAFHPGHVCGKPTRHRTVCFVQLRPRARGSRRGPSKPTGWGATDLRSAYDMGQVSSGTSTIGVIDAFGYPHAEADLNHYRAQYGLPPCTTANGCFTKLNQKGQQGSYPTTDQSWGLETALDLQMVSAACPTCRIVLVEANNPGDPALTRAERTAVAAGAIVTSHSYGRIELTGDDSRTSMYDHPGVTAVASTGDAGYGPANFPASSPDVVSVGGTVLAKSPGSVRGWAEQAWEFASSGCSAYFAKPLGQPGTSCPGRSVADVSAVASNLAVYDTSLPKFARGWEAADGTSASAPLVAGMIASVGDGGLRPPALYAMGADAFNDVVRGSNGFCRGNYLCTAVAGYDGPTGLGTPTSPQVFAKPE
jgi:hypothetical protein